MDSKPGITQNSQMNNPLNAIAYPNAYNLLIPNQIQITQEMDIQNENQNDNSTQNKVENVKESEPILQKKIRKRATKKESDIRNYKCTFCDKSYLSYPALYTHCKQKHNTNNHSGRNRGRPKKEQSEINSEKNRYDPMTLAYFQKEERTGNTKIENINACAMNAFKYLYQNKNPECNMDKKIKDRKMKEYSKVEDHPFLGLFLKDPHDTNIIIGDEKASTDFVLINYLNKMSLYCNEKYFEKLIIFVTLFREHINLVNQDKVEKDQEFTQITEAEDVPESSNEFITDFLFPEDEEHEFGLDKDEAIDLTRNLCNWMYINNFTCSKLFLLDKEK
jgi:hypothetical protein